MSRKYALKAAKRERAGKGVARTLRREGRVPAVVYGDGKEPVKISLSTNEATIEYRKGHMFTNICDLNLDGQDHLVLVRDVQQHPVTDFIEHIDFLRVTPKTKIAVKVPVHFINHEDSPGIFQKGVLNVVRHEVELMCSAMDIPESIDVNLAGKELGDAVKISDAVLPTGVKPVITNRDFTIATVVAPKTGPDEDEVKAAEGEAAAEAAPAAAGQAPAGEKKAPEKKAPEKK
ncbi:MAG: 50S ribosomal protein L25/general stress protein Ctc [Alphaproteobacteria bacterium]|nr:50S ribosomal protein L25/general stress protein Ctc [Alphaproteobacteria bacterium]MBP7758921.1 50S ribosomal protein L25/general stress protein Ctc [Alphaproteobacteria bacterium]MBP7762196.1 50S ribosomal protein L25/general stress protein Ctc [Alphaproteobacteria bacterium]MBP7905807.1 50S ribosomal protein L25/general stress protein Ctc [Alphaproteobacteria bacterium]